MTLVHKIGRELDKEQKKKRWIYFNLFILLAQRVYFPFLSFFLNKWLFVNGPYHLPIHSESLTALAMPERKQK